MLIIKQTITFIALIAMLPASANYKVYEADLSESKWQFKGNPIGCELNHEVPYYGNATFKKESGKKQPLLFNLSYKRQPLTMVKVASVQSLSPSWLPKQRARNLGEVEIKQGKNIFQTTNTASWKLLNELEVGRFPTFRYQDFETIEDQVAVSLSSVGFKKPYDQFLSCLVSLVPYKLYEINKMTLHFDFAKHSLKKTYLDKLKALAQYVRYDPSIEVIIINGYTDSKGPKGYNLKLSERRVNTVKEMLSLDGTDPNRFKTKAFGEKNRAASNRSSNGRAKNRRVVIRVSQK